MNSFITKACALGVGITIGLAPFVLVTPAFAADTGIEQTATAGLKVLGAETVETRFGSVVIERFMPELRDARIQGIAIPETSGPGDEVAIDLRSLVGDFEYDSRTGELISVPGSANRAPETVVDPAGRTPFVPSTDWSQFTWRIEGLPGTGVVDYLADDEGQLTLVPRQANAAFGATVTLVHVATGVESAPISITGQAGTNGTSADWLYQADRAEGDGNAPLWKANERGFIDGKFLSWSEPEETTLAAPASWSNSVRPWLDVASSGRVEAQLWASAGFGLEDTGNSVQPLSIRTAARVGQAHSELVGSFSVDLAERLPELGITALALPGAPDGTLALDAAPAWTQPYGVGGLDYQAADGLTFTVDGTTVRGEFGSAEWTNAVGVTVFVLTDAGVQAVELRVEARPADTAAGLVEKRVATDTEVLITDTEMLEASRLSGLEPTIRQVRAMTLPEGVERVEDGFLFAGAAEPTALAFGFEVTETFETPFGPVRPDAVRAPGEVRIEVFEDAVTPPVEEPEPPVTEEPEPPVTEPPAEEEPPAKPEPSKPTPPKRVETGDNGSPVWQALPGAAAVLALIGGLAAYRRRPEGAAE